MRALVTGIDGFAGRHLAALLRGRGDEVHGDGARRRSRRPALGARARRRDVAARRSTSRDADGRRRGGRRGARRTCSSISPAAPSCPTPPPTRPARSRVNALGHAARARRGGAPRAALPRAGGRLGRCLRASCPTRRSRSRESRRCARSAPTAPARRRPTCSPASGRAATGLDVVRVRPFNHTGPGQDARFVCADFARQLVAVRARRARRRASRSAISTRCATSATCATSSPPTSPSPSAARAAPSTTSAPASAARSARCSTTLIAVVGVPVEIVPVARDAGARRRSPLLVGSAAALIAATGWQPRIAWEQTIADLVATADAPDVAAARRPLAR